MVVYGIKWKCEGPFQSTDVDRAQISAIGQGVLYMVYSSVFHVKTHDWAYDNWKS
jgi:hypothetical protein